MSETFLKCLEDRRSYYGIGPESPVSDEKILQVVQDAVKHTPSAFNSQNARAVLLLGAHHRRVWDITEETLKKIVPEDGFGATAEKLASFRSGYGTVLFFEDTDIVEGLQKQFPLYQENFPLWSQQAAGMTQHAVWVALELCGFGASLQHYNPLINEAVAKEWNIPTSWKLIAQMPFGKPTAEPGPKDFISIEERVKIFK